MLEEPYRWVEAVRNRREYLDDQLADVSPVVGLSYCDGVLLLTTTPGPRKLFEVYDHLAFAAVGHPADIEKLRKAVIDVAHVEGFNLSSSDVTLHRLVNYGLGPLMKGAFDEIFRSPFIAQVLMSELSQQRPQQQEEIFYAVDADGSFATSTGLGVVAGSERAQEAATQRLVGLEGGTLSLEAGLSKALEAWAIGRLYSSDEETEPDEAAIAECLSEVLAHQRIEAAVLDRTLPKNSKFRLLSPDETAAATAAYAAQ